jgi:iron(III) transport system ATP-binding protein
MIRIENLHLTYRTSDNVFHALRGVSLDMARGDFTALLGPSGCGKTTLLRSIAGLEEPDSGRITIDNKDVFNSDEGIDVSAAKRNLGMVFQSYAIWPHMSVFENVVFPLRYRRRELSRQDVRERAMHCLELVRLGALADRPAPMLSGGQQQRLALARALCADPTVLLLDEPLSNLDARLREDMRFELRAITRKSGVTTVFVTHEQNEALSMADRVVVMNGGEVIQDDTPEGLYRSPKTEFVATFLGRSNVLSATVTAFTEQPERKVTVSSAVGSIRCRSYETTEIGRPVRLVVRPESIGVVPANGSGKPVAKVEALAFLGDVVECLLRLGGVSLVAKIPASAVPKVGSEVTLNINEDETLVLMED